MVVLVCPCWRQHFQPSTLTLSQQFSLTLHHFNSSLLHRGEKAVAYKLKFKYMFSFLKCNTIPLVKHEKTHALTFNMAMLLTARGSVFHYTTLHYTKWNSSGGGTYGAYVGPGLQVFDGLAGQLLFVQLSVDLRQLWHPETIAVLPEDLSDATLDLLRVVGQPFVWTGVLMKIHWCYIVMEK